MNAITNSYITTMKISIWYWHETYRALGGVAVVLESCFQAYILGCRVYTVWCRASTCSTRTTLAYPIFVVAKVCISARARFRSNRALQKDICDWLQSVAKFRKTFIQVFKRLLFVGLLSYLACFCRSSINKGYTFRS